MQCPTHQSKLQAMEGEVKNANCEICGEPAGLQCKTCEFRLCEECRICSKRHALVKVVELGKVNPDYYNNNYSCNVCSKSMAANDDAVWHCNECNFDICPDCLP